MTRPSAPRYARGSRHVALLAALALMLVACSTGPETGTIRDPDARISSQVNVTADRLAGDWHIRTGWPGTSDLVGTLSLAQSGNALTLTLTGTAVKGPVEATLTPLGQGRFRAGNTETFGDSPLWVLWMDADNRTAAIGTPDGRYGWIMDRTATGGADRITAAREIMEWMGYDLSLSKETSQ